MIYTRSGQPTARGPHVAHEQFLCDPPGSQREKNNMDEHYVYPARGVGAARDEYHNSFSAHGG